MSIAPFVGNKNTVLSNYQDNWWSTCGPQSSLPIIFDLGIINSDMDHNGRTQRLGMSNQELVTSYHHTYWCLSKYIIIPLWLINDEHLSTKIDWHVWALLLIRNQMFPMTGTLMTMAAPRFAPMYSPGKKTSNCQRSWEQKNGGGQGNAHYQRLMINHGGYQRFYWWWL